MFGAVEGEDISLHLFSAKSRHVEFFLVCPVFLRGIVRNAKTLVMGREGSVLALREEKVPVKEYR